eukprot:1736103-Rhodomonas_salina.1
MLSSLPPTPLLLASVCLCGRFAHSLTLRVWPMHTAAPRSRAPAVTDDPFKSALTRSESLHGASPSPMAASSRGLVVGSQEALSHTHTLARVSG